MRVQTRKTKALIKNVKETKKKVPVGSGAQRKKKTRRGGQASDLKRLVEDWEKTFDSISDMVFIQDNDFTITRVNRAFSSFMGKSARELVGKKCYDLLHKRDSPWHDCPFEMTKEDGKSHTFRVEDEVIGVPLLVTTSPILDEKGEVLGSVHISKDVTFLRRAEEKLSAIYTLSRKISLTTNLENIFESIIAGCENILNYKMIALTLLDEERRELYSIRISGHPKEILDIRFPIDSEKGIMAWVATHGKSLIVPDVSKDARYLCGDPRVMTRSEIAVPLKVGERVVGVLNVESENLDAFSEDDRMLLETLASQTSVAIENARLLEREKESALKAQVLLVQLSKLFEVSKSITRPTNLQETLDTIVNAVVTTGTWKCALISLRDESGFYNRCAFAGIPPEHEARLRTTPVSPQIEKVIFDPRMRISRSYYHPHGGPTMRALNAVTVVSDMPLEECVDWHPEDLLFIPFYDKGGMILGYLNVDEPTDGRRPTEESLKILETFANNAASAIENVRLLEREKESAERAHTLLLQLSQLFEVSNSMVTITNLKETLDTIVSAIRGLGMWRKAIIRLMHDDGYLHAYAFAGYAEEEKKKLVDNTVSPDAQRFLFDEKDRISRSYYHPHGCPAVQALNMVIVESRVPLSECIDWHPDDLFIIPFYGRSGAIIGYLCVDEPTDGRRPTVESIRILETFANNAATAIENIRLFDRVARSDKLKEMFISIISHDLKNPLTVIRGYNGLLSETTDEKARAYTHKIEESVAKMALIIDEARLYSRVKDETYMKNFEARGIGSLVTSAMECVSEKASLKRISLSFEAQNPPVFAHATLENVFINILDNAIKYAPVDSEVVIRVEERGGVIRITIADGGKGIPDQFKQRIFEKFERAENEGIEGSGLGLAIAREIVLRHSGKIWVEDNTPHGSIFVIELPRAAPYENLG